MSAMKKRGFLGIFAIYSLIFLSNGTLLLSPAMDTLVLAFPHEPYSKVLLTYTLPSLVALPFTLISGSVVGSRVRFRTMLLVVVPCYMACGVAPVLLNSLDGVLLCRALYGACLGMIAPQGNALILRTFHSEERWRYLGYSNIMVGMAGVVFQLLGGLLCGYGWRYIFLAYLVTLIPLLLILFGLKEPEAPPKLTDAPAPTQTGRPSLLPKGVIPLFLLVAFLYMSSQTKMLTLSSIVATQGIGDAKTSAGILSTATAGAMLGGVVFPWYCRRVTRYRIPILIALLAATTFCNLVDSPLVIGVGYAVGTMAFMMNLNLMTLRASRIFGTQASSRAMGLIQFADKCGCFAATYFATAAVWAAEAARLPINKYKMPVVACAGIYMAAAVLDALGNGPDTSQCDTE